MEESRQNQNGKVICKVNKIRNSMQLAIEEPNRRRGIKKALNKNLIITPKTIKKEIHDLIQATYVADDEEKYVDRITDVIELPKKEQEKVIEQMEKEMREAAKELNFERATELRDMIFELQAEG